MQCTHHLIILTSHVILHLLYKHCPLQIPLLYQIIQHKHIICRHFHYITNTEFATSKTDGYFVPSVVSSSRTNLELLQSSNSPFPINANIDERVGSRLSGENFNRMLPFSFTPKSSNDELTLQLGVSDKSTTNSNYLHACYSQQLKRYEKLKKEYDEEKERLRIIIEEISERESELYNHRYVVQPNPTDEQIALLVKENEKLKKSVDELSKNIDRIENGRAFLPPVDVRHHDVHRIQPLAQRPRDIFDRSQSVPCIQPQDSIPMKQLSRPSTERQVRHTISCDESSAYYQVKPSNDSALQDWSLINKVPKFPFVPGEGTSEESQWSCRECTFLNHESLLTCEICNTARHQ
ncbi:TGF-beta-activated kinase 1 and MAP3K7-binding protein 3-like isoform X2 [Xenia sp. Carnegie-2017]|uniref:TGF-beta-activated kinase 1 and MAP3K7-binding protein 3-like isoform X2 n=1 Tax=Xenia sp. Carnegie-2017 TaxID=2897299 RepID=UPI001F0481A5|nr:TGF-beta-activated kinase 1 and MAP3K7-binding protein 3-like isoform X2 [Xenia sp. Carnegie-2017]